MGGRVGFKWRRGRRRGQEGKKRFVYFKFASLRNDVRLVYWEIMGKENRLISF